MGLLEIDGVDFLELKKQQHDRLKYLQGLNREVRDKFIDKAAEILSEEEMSEIFSSVQDAYEKGMESTSPLATKHFGVDPDIESRKDLFIWAPLIGEIWYRYKHKSEE